MCLVTKGCATALLLPIIANGDEITALKNLGSRILHKLSDLVHGRIGKKEKEEKEPNNELTLEHYINDTGVITPTSKSKKKWSLKSVWDSIFHTITKGQHKVSPVPELGKKTETASVRLDKYFEETLSPAPTCKPKKNWNLKSCLNSIFHRNTKVKGAAPIEPEISEDYSLIRPLNNHRRTQSALLLLDRSRGTTLLDSMNFFSIISVNKDPELSNESSECSVEGSDFSIDVDEDPYPSEEDMKRDFFSLKLNLLCFPTSV